MNKGFGELLQQLRKEKGWTQQQLAEFLSVSNKTVSKWERNESYPEITTLIEISKLFNISVDDLLNGRDVKKATELSDVLYSEWQTVKASIASRILLFLGLFIFYGIYFITHEFIPGAFVFLCFVFLLALGQSCP